MHKKFQTRDNPKNKSKLRIFWFPLVMKQNIALAIVIALKKIT